MEIKGRAFCLFEQSGTFRDEFRKLGIPADCYDIRNDYNTTDHVIDLFTEIEKGWAGNESIFDAMTPNDLTIAFFPCTFFCGSGNPPLFRIDHKNYRRLTMRQTIEAILDRAHARERYYAHLVTLAGIYLSRGLRLIVENPHNAQGYLVNNFLQSPAVIDPNRRERGDYYHKPTAYWFFNCAPTRGKSTAPRPAPSRCVQRYGSSAADVRARSEISPDYARAFICDFVIGKDQGLEAPLFYEEEKEKQP